MILFLFYFGNVTKKLKIAHVLMPCISIGQYYCRLTALILTTNFYHLTFSNRNGNIEVKRKEAFWLLYQLNWDNNRKNFKIVSRIILPDTKEIFSKRQKNDACALRRNGIGLRISFEFESCAFIFYDGSLSLIVISLKSVPSQEAW